MLVLSRMRDQSIMIGDYEVKVIDIRGDKVRLGVTAPKDVPVHRTEIRDAIRRDARKAAVRCPTCGGTNVSRCARTHVGICMECERGEMFRVAAESQVVTK